MLVQSNQNLPGNSLDKIIDFFDHIGVATEEENTFGKLIHLFRTKKWVPEEGFSTKLTLNISELFKASDSKDLKKDYFKIALATNALVQARNRLSKQSSRKSNPEINHYIDEINSSLRLLDKISQNSSDRKIENLDQVLIVNEMTAIVGSLSNEVNELIETILQNNDGYEFLNSFLEQIIKYREENRNKLSEGIIAKDDSQFIFVIEQNMKAPDFPEADKLVLLLNEIASLCMSTNTQINSDGFAIGLFDPHKESDKTLSLPGTAEDRTLSLTLNESGYRERPPFLQQRTLWLDVVPSNIRDGNIPFISGTRQICFKLHDGSKKEATAHLDLSPLGELSFQENRNVLQLICSVCSEYSESTLAKLDEKIKSHPLDVEDLESEKIQIIAQKLNFSKEKFNVLINLALKFNRELTINMCNALFNLTPDLKQSCREELSKILKDEFNLNDWEVYWESNGLENTHEILKKCDQIQYLRSFGLNDEEAQINLQSLVQKSVNEITNIESHTNIVIALNLILKRVL